MIQPTICEIRRMSGNWIFRIGLTLALVLGSGDVYAGPTRRDEAETLFNEARKLVDAGQYAEGCPKFEASFALFRSASTMINIARCHEHDGKLATAWQDYQRAIASSKDTEDEQRRKELIDIAQKGMRALEPRLPKLRIVIPEAPVGVQVVRGETKIPTAALLQDLAVDPGQHEIRVSAPGFRPETRIVTLEERKTVTVEFSLQRIDVSEMSSGNAGATNTSGPPRNRWRPVGISLLAGGAVGLGIGATSGILALEKIKDVKARCGGVHCPSNDKIARDDVNSAMSLGTVSTASFVAGGVLASAGAVFVVLDHLNAHKSVAPSVGFSVGFRQFTVGASF